jgi:hypothetical protein
MARLFSADKIYNETYGKVSRHERLSVKQP